MRMQRRVLGVLFAALTAGFAGVAAAAIAAHAGARGWVIGLAAAALAVWMAELSYRALR